jgi:hypothetical protein
MYTVYVNGVEVGKVENINIEGDIVIAGNYMQYHFAGDPKWYGSLEEACQHPVVGSVLESRDMSDYCECCHEVTDWVWCKGPKGMQRMCDSCRSDWDD